MPLLRIKKGVKEFSGQKVLDGFDISVRKGDFIGFIGGSGSGKSTVLKILIGYHKLDSGTIEYDGEDVTEDAGFIKSKAGFCTQENSFYFELTVRENMYYYGRLYGLWGKTLKERVDELLKLVELSQRDTTVAKNLSGGMKRRLDFAISLIHDLEIVVFDEPTTGLDPILRKKLWGLMAKINRQGKTIIVTSHFINHIRDYCKRVAILKNGRVAAIKSPAEFSKQYGGVKNFEEIFEGIIK